MGYQMARHMVNKGFDVAGYDVLPEAMTRAKAAGVKTVGGVADVGESAEVVIVMVATDKQVEDVIVQSGLLDRLKKGAVVCVSSSTSPETSREMEAHLQQTRHRPSRHARRARPGSRRQRHAHGVLSAARPMPSRRRSLPSRRSAPRSCMSAPSGMGQLTKTANNMLLWACMAANYEVLSFAKKMGADIPKLVEALQYSSGANWSLEKWGRGTAKWVEKDRTRGLAQFAAAWPLLSSEQLTRGHAGGLRWRQSARAG